MSRFVTYSVVALMSLFGGLALAQSSDPLQVDIAAQPLGDALNQFAEQSGLQVVLYADDAKGIHVAGVSGQFDRATVALDSLLASTGLEYSFINERTVAVTPVQKVAEEGGDSDSGKERPAGARQRPVMMAQEERSQKPQEREPEAKEGKEELPIEEIVVTGTNIRGVVPDSSPFFAFDREDIDKTGFGTVSEFIQSLPQNFGGGSNADVQALPNDRTAVANFAAGSSVNFRGLGAGSTLVLLNGRRLAPAGDLGDFVDISMIPLSAVERIEVLTDGASAIYGADAIAGVVNFVLREDYDGAETLVRVGNATEGDFNEYRAGQTVGKSWGTGNALISYELFHRDTLDAADRDFASAVPLPRTLLPGQQSHNVLLNASQDLSERITLRGHGTYSQREADNVSTDDFGASTFTASNTEQYGGSAGLTIELLDDWLLDLSGDYNKLKSSFDRTGAFAAQIQAESALWSVDGKVDGTVFSLPGGDVRLATGVSYREEAFTFRRLDIDLQVTDDKRNIFGAFAEVFIPIVGADNRVPWVERLELSLAGRYDDYSDFGDTLNPKVGLLWSPLDDLNLRGTYSTSFNPPNLGDTGFLLGNVRALFAPNAASPTGTSLVIFDLRAPELGPETSTTWTAGIDYRRDVGPGEFNVSATWFDIGYEDRIDRAGIVINALNNPVEFAPVIIADPDPSLTEAIIAEAVANGQGFFDSSGGAWMMPGDEDFILDNRLLNLAGVDVTGIDVNLGYDVETKIGELSFELNSSYLFKLEKQISTASPVFDEVSTIFNPIDFRLRGSVSWSHGGWNASTFVNYVDGYVDDRNLLGSGDVPVDSWTTVDFNLSYDTGDEGANAVVSNTKFSLSVLNLLDQDPPTVSSLEFFSARGFDPANASPLGRFISFQITKQW